MDILISDLNGETVTGRFYEKRIGLEPKLRAEKMYLINFTEHDKKLFEFAL